MQKQSPAGETQTRSETLASLEQLLAIPPEKRPTPTLDFLYVKETGWNILAVYWVYRQSEHQTNRGRTEANPA
jgi:hypothetical protein